MKIVAGGCSFTYNNEMTWAGEVAQDYDLINMGSCASGNDYIARSVIHQLEKQDNPFLICQWSGVHRKSYYIDQQHILAKTLSNSDWPDWAGNYTDIDNDAVKQADFWVKTGGNNIHTAGSNELIHKHFVEPYAKYFYSDEQALGHFGQTGGITSVFKIYISSSPGGIWLLGTPCGSNER